MNSRQPVGYVTSVDGTSITLNLLDQHRGMMAAHSQGISNVTEIGSLLGIDSGHTLLVLKVLGISFAEPREVHRQSVGKNESTTEPLRNLNGVVIGRIDRRDEHEEFLSDSLSTPALGSMVYPLLDKEFDSIMNSAEERGPQINIGNDLRTGATINVSLTDFISRHVAVLGSSGQGKSCFTAAVLQQVVELAGSRVVVFDVNGEYEQAFSNVPNRDLIKVTKLGGDFRIPYYALGRHGIQRLLIPSEKTQRPALVFALDNLNRVQWFDNPSGAGLQSDKEPYLFDDCRAAGAAGAAERIDTLREGTALTVANWPPMKALAPLVAESYALSPGRVGWERNAFQFGNISPLVTRIHRFVEDDMFSAVIDTQGGPGLSNPLNWSSESTALVNKVFGSNDTAWRVHVVDLRMVTHDLMPFVLGALLELYAYELFKRGQDNKIPTLLVLEEAHHYLRSALKSDEDTGSGLAYERLAKEGRKFGLALWLSTQRPSELSPTVLSQCNNWVSFKLNSERDLSSVQAASEWADKREVKRIAGLARRNALAFGGSIKMPVLIQAPLADPTPKSEDAPFSQWGQGDAEQTNCPN